MMLQQGADAVLGGLGHGLSQGIWSWLSLKASVIGDFGDFVFFKFVMERLQHDIRLFGDQVLGRMMTFISVISLTVLTIWVFLQGYKVVTGTLRESMMGLVVTTLKAVFIVGLALGFGKANDTFSTFLVDDMPSGIHYMITGKDGPPSEEIDSNLGWMQVAMSSIDALDAGGDLAGNLEKERANTWIGMGTGGPAITAGALLLMYQVAIALFVGLGPLFILCLLFDSTKSLFQKWLFYGIGTMFSMAVLSAMVSIALAMVRDVAIAMWASDAINALILGDGSTGYSSRALQTGSMGMILTLLLITVPPMAASFFNGTMGQFMHYSAFGGGGGGGRGDRDGLRDSPGANGPGGSPYGGGGRPPQGARDRGSDVSDQTSTAYGARTNTYQPNVPTSTPGSRGAANPSDAGRVSGGGEALQSYQDNFRDGKPISPGERRAQQDTRVANSPTTQPQGPTNGQPPPKQGG